MSTDSQPLQTMAQPQTYETKLRVRYAETDQMGVVYHSNFIVWFEVGRVEMMRQLGFSYNQMEQQDGQHLAVADVRCRYKSPARYDDLILIRTHLINVRDSLVHFGYEILRDEDGTLLAEGESVHLVLDREFKRTRLSQRYLPAFLKAAGRS
ncbi:MAG: acyl-CoA thioesterase [Candidatus Korobacteraceae bacterium]